MSTQDNSNRRLQELGNSDYEIASGQPDIRGWNVVDTNGRKIGEVDEIIFDAESQKVRYVVLDLEDNAFRLKPKNVLIPIGLLELHTNDDDVILNHVTIDQLQLLPAYEKDDLDTDLESRIPSIFSGTEASPETMQSNSNTDFYSHEHFEDNLKRNHPADSISKEPIRMRQEPSFLEREGSNHMDIDDDVDKLQEDRVLLEEKDAVPVTNNPVIRAGNDIDEWDRLDDNTLPGTNSDIERKNRDSDEGRNKPTDL